jgi:NAD(P)-dependent dehydrogenase (short-subunit alcohol dehydrogenase family)
MVQQYDFADATVIVTGAASGIGRETAVGFGRAGANVVVADLDTDEGEATARLIEEETNGTATFVEVDVTDDDAVAAMVDTAVSEYGGLDVAFNNAGIGGDFNGVDEIPEEDWQAVIDVNLTGVWRCMRHEIPAMLENGGGAIVNTASILGKVGTADAPAYTAAKHGVLGLTKGAALERATDGIRVNAICPGYVETQMLEEAGIMADDDLRSQIEGLHAMQRLGTAEEIADAVLWLASDGASFTTGEALVVDGGYTAQ